MPGITILEVPVFSMLCNEAFRLRRAVFITEQNVPADEEYDADDLTATHVVAVGGGEVRGTLRIIRADGYVKIGRVVVSKDARGMGVASAMIGFAMALQPEGARFYLTAQTDKTALYEKFGFRSFGDVFDDGGMPHIAMKTY